MRRVRLAAVLLLACAPALLFAGDDLAVVRAAEGYSIARPDARWQVREIEAPETVWHALKLQREPAPAEVSVTVYLGDTPPGATAALLCAGSALRWKALATGPVTRSAQTLRAGEAFSLTCDVRSGGEVVRVRQVYVVHGADVLLVQCQAPAASWGEHEKEFDAALASIAFLPEDAARGDARRVRALAARCGSDVPRAKTWAEAAARAAKERRLVLVVCEMYRGLPIRQFADTTTFMDEDVAALCRARFVVLPWKDGNGAPFDAPQAYGLGSHTFGQGVLFVTPEGRVAGGLGMLEPSFVDEAARAALAACPEATGAAADPLDAAAALRRGELDRAEALLRSPATADAWMLRAALHRRRHRADEALAALDAAEKLGADGRAVDLERGLVLLRASRIDEAAAAFRRAGDSPAARYWHAVTRALRQGVEPVRSEFLAVAKDAAETRWSWRAAAVLLGRGVATGVESVVWPDAAVRESATPRATAAAAAGKAAADALAFLLRTQRADGTWPVPMAFAPDRGGSVTTAVTSIAASALLRHRGEPGVDRALERAVDAVLAARGRLVAPRGGVFDYTIWAQTFALRFLAAHAKGLAPAAAERKAALEVAAEIVHSLARTQQPSGGWSYAQLEGAGASADNSISFVTAAALLALLDAREAGVSVPEGVLAKAAAVVASLRRDDGSWNYQTATAGISEPSEAAMRGPLCALALARSGHAKDPRDVERALAALAAQAPVCFRQAGKPLCHTAPDGVSAYYLLFGCRYAADALREVPAAAAGPARATILAEVLRLRRDDGSFQDFPPIGPAYGTAMALEILELLQPGAR